MKNILIIAMTALLVSCTKENVAEFSQQMTEAHLINLSDSTIPESGGRIALTMDVTNKIDGVLFYAVSPTEIAMPSAYDLISGNVVSLAYGEFDVTDANHEYLIDLDGYPEYYVYTVLRNVEDAITPVLVDTMMSNDVTGPYLLADLSSPAQGTIAETSPIIELVFNEAIMLGDAFAMELTAMLMVEDDLPNVTKSVRVQKSDLIVNGNRVTIDMSEVEFACGNNIIMSASLGAFVDEAGNPSDKIAWVHDGNEILSMDYFFEAMNTEINDTMLNFVGLNSLLTLVDDEMNGAATSYNVTMKDCSNSTVLLTGIFGLYNDLEFAFDLETGDITFEEYETGVYYDEEENGFIVGDPDTTTQHRAYYKPLNLDGTSGQFSIANKTFQAGYILYVEMLGTIATVVNNYSRVGTVSTKSAKAQPSVQSDEFYLQKIEEFRYRNKK